MECRINSLGFCEGRPEKCLHGENCPVKDKCKYVYTTPEKGWGAPHDNCRFQEQNWNGVDQTNSDKVLTDKLTICTLNINNKVPDRSKLEEFLEDLSHKDSIVCLQEFRNDKDLMKLKDHLMEKRSKFTFCGRSSHGHCAVLSTLPLQEVENRWKYYHWKALSSGALG